MARVAGVNIPNEKRIEASLQYIYGVGLTLAKKTLKETGVNPDVSH
jgi:small subunit ribosomal protein S13